jgi:beta-lactam-binding protein with PASTA domain/predicted Ser/Thr protein kinase
MTTPRLLGSRYEIGETLGYGGMAEVHLARDVRLGREVAVKVLRADLARDPSFQTRFRREAQAAASLNHPAIVAVYDTGEDLSGPNGSTPYIVMEFVEGRTLREVLKTEGRLMPRRAMEIVADVCAALDFSHRNGIVHRDVKPGNVMITPTGAVKVMDFGIARAVADAGATVTATAAVIGTAQYLSPEQARGENVDARSDVYSTGCLLYELLTGHPPFTGDSPVAVAYQHVRETARPPSSANPDVPPALDAIVMKALAKNPANRYQTAAEMRADLIRSIQGRPVSAEPIMSDDERTTVLGGTGAMAPSGYGGAAYGDGGYTGSHLREPVEEERRGRRAAGWIALAVAVLLVFVLAAFLTARLLNGGGKSEVSVPNLVGKTRAAAEQAIRDAGLTVGEVKTVPSSAQDKDRVVSQDPQAGLGRKRDEQVSFSLGGGPASVSVPDVAGLTYDAAAQRLTDLKLKPQRVNADRSEPAGQVVGSDPKAGTPVAEGQTVKVVVSTGRVEIPDVTGKSEGDARAQLNGAGFTNVVTQRAVPPDDFAAGTVFRMDPVGHTKAAFDQKITLFVALEKPTPTTTQPTTTPPAPTTTPPAPTTTPPTP